MSDERELRAALEAAQAKLKAAEAEAAKNRAKTQELEAQREHHQREMRDLLALLDRKEPPQNEQQERELQSLRAQLTLAQREVADLRHAEKKWNLETPAPKEDSPDEGGYYAVVGLLVALGGLFLMTQGTGGGLCLIVLGALLASPWIVIKLLS